MYIYKECFRREVHKREKHVFLSNRGNERFKEQRS